VVNTTADTGSGTLRQALSDAQSGDSITFDPTVFPPTAPATIYLTSSLPPITQGNLKIDASNAGVILDGSDIPGDWFDGLAISSDGNIIQGLQIINFSGSGIALWTASHNTIGPDNVIAYNGAFGVEVWDPGSVGNTITQNRIHNNDRTGIDLWDGGNSELAAPCIVDFDLTAGTVTGATCANCTLEIFSDSSDEGETYEGGTTADGVGFFTFNKGASFTGPHLTATATDADGNTSRFSAPTSGTSRTIVLQEGNNLPKTQLQPKQSRELLDNRIGDSNTAGLRAYPEGFEDWLVDQMTNLGLKWSRLSLDVFDWSEVAKGAAEYSRYYIDPIHDEVITDLAKRGIKIM